jgi:hypothetical protein
MRQASTATQMGDAAQHKSVSMVHVVSGALTACAACANACELVVIGPGCTPQPGLTT